MARCLELHFERTGIRSALQWGAVRVWLCSSKDDWAWFGRVDQLWPASRQLVNRTTFLRPIKMDWRWSEDESQIVTSF